MADPAPETTLTLGSPRTIARPTTQIRWLMRVAAEGEPGIFIDGRKPVLQQAWLIDTTGQPQQIEWRDVEVVVEHEEKNDAG